MNIIINHHYIDHKKKGVQRNFSQTTSYPSFEEFAKHVHKMGGFVEVLSIKENGAVYFRGSFGSTEPDKVYSEFIGVAN